MTHNSLVKSVAFSPDGRYVDSGSRDKTARVWDTASGKEIARMMDDGFVRLGCLQPGWQGKYVVSENRLWVVASGKEITHMTHDNSVYSVVFSPDGKYVVSGSYDGTARFWAAVSGKEIARVTHDQSVNSVAFSPDGTARV